MAKVRRAQVEGYETYFGTDEDEKLLALTPGCDTIGKPSDTEIDDMEEFEKQELAMKRN